MKNRRFLQDNVVFMGGTVLAGLLGYLFHFFVARKLTVAEYGEVQSVFALVAMSSLFASAFSYFALKYSSFFAARNDYRANDEFIAYLNKKILKVVSIISALLLIFSLLIKNILHLSDVWGIVAGIVAIFFGTAAVAFQESLRAWQKFFVLSIIGVLGAAAKLVFGFGFAAFFGKATPVVFSLTISAFLGWLAAVYFWRKLKTEAGQEKKKNWQEYISIKKIWKNAIQIFFYSLAAALILNIDVLIVKSLTTSEMTGYYSALSVLGKISLLLNMSIVGVVLPQACRDGHQGKKLQKKIFFLSFFLIVAIGLVFVLIYYLVPEIFVVMIFGQKYQNISGNLWLFAVMSLVLSLLKFESDLAFARHDFRINYLLLFTAILMSLSIYFFHSTLSSIAVSISVSLLIGYIFAIILNNLHDNKEITEPLI